METKTLISFFPSILAAIRPGRATFIAALLPFQILLFSHCWAAKDDADTLAVNEEIRRSGYLPLPILYFTPETGIAGGGAILALYRADEEVGPDRPSSIMVDLIYTQKQQLVAELFPDIYLQKNLYRLVGSVQYSRFPQKFYGIGNNTPDNLEESYTARTFRVSVDAVRRILGNISGGISMVYDHRSFSDLEPAGMLKNRSVAGRHGGTTSAMGLVAYLDTRDNPFAPDAGRYYGIWLRKAAPALGSDYEFTSLTLDLRHYYAITETAVLAMQVLATLNSGNVPFYMLAQLGGMDMMRGYYEGRYRDKEMLAAQAEYRFPVFWKFGGTAFVGAGDVAPALDQFTVYSVKPSYGFGLRYLFDPNERLSIRLDFGFGKNTSGMYISANQAF